MSVNPNNITTPFLGDFDDAVERFQAVNTAIDEMDHAKDNMVRAQGEISDDVLRSIALEGLKSRGLSALESTQEAFESAPYPELFRAYDYVAQRTIDLETALSPYKNTLDQIQHDLDVSIELVPDSETELTAAAETKRQDLLTDEVKDLFDDLASVAETREELEKLLELSARPWPIYPIGGLAMHGSGVEIEEIVMDEIPVEPNIISASHDSRTTDKLRVVEAPDATAKIVEYLIKNRNSVVTVEELSTILYGRIEPDHDENLRCRVTTLLGPKISGPMISKILESYGLGLQYGWRLTSLRNNDSTKFISRKRIYRVIDPSNISELPNAILVTNPVDGLQQYSDKWGNIIMGGMKDPEIEEIAEREDKIEQNVEGEVSDNRRRIEKKDASVDLAEIFEQNVGRVFTVAELAKLLYSNSEADTTVLTKRINALLGNELIKQYLMTSGLVLVRESAQKSVKTKKGHTTNVRINTYKVVAVDTKDELIPRQTPSQPELSLEKVVEPESTEPKAEIDADWEKELQKLVEETITYLRDNKVVFSGTQTVQQLRSITPKHSIFTVTGIKKAHKAGLIEGKIDERNVTGIELNMQQVIAMSLLSTVDFVHKGPRQKQALKIIRNSVASFLKNYKK